MKIKNYFQFIFNKYKITLIFVLLNILFHLILFFLNHKFVFTNSGNGRSNNWKSSQIFLVFIFFNLFVVLAIFIFEFFNSKIRTLKLKVGTGTILFTIVYIPSLLTLYFRDLIDKYFLYFFSIGHIFPNFSDLRGVLVGINEVNTVGQQIPCEVNQCASTAWIYGRMLLYLGNIPVNNFSVYSIVFILTLIFLQLVKKLRTSFTENALHFIFFISPPIVLLFERFNIEILIAILLLYAFNLYNKNNFLLSFALVGIASLIKFFPLVLCIFYFKKFIPRLQRLIILIQIFIISSIVYQDNLNLGADISPGLTGTVGLKNIYLILSSSNYPVVLVFIFLIIFGFALNYINQMLLEQNLNKNYIINKTDKFGLEYFGLLFIFCFFVNSNYIYRFIFLYFAIVYLWKIFPNRDILLNILIIYFFYASQPAAVWNLSRNLGTVFILFILIKLIKISFYDSFSLKMRDE